MMNRFINALVPEYTNEQTANSSYKFSIKFFINLIWLVSSAYLISYLEIEKNKGFDKVALILTAAFLAYTFIPLKLRKLFLFGLVFVIETYLFGIKILIGITILLIYFVVITYVKNKQFRMILIIASVLLGILITSKIFILPHIRLIVMFTALFLMLRYIFLLYELNYFKKPPVFIDRLCYLFLIPSACFPLFPVVSPVEYLKSFYDHPSEISFRRGLNWITIGIFHLLIYRVIYMYFSPSSYDITSFGMWIWFIFSAYSLIFRLSGLFYLAVGFLQLFGFKLPLVFNHVYFASGFADLWRRVNLYWRAFMIRVFYYPLVFKFKKFNSKPFVFFATLTMFGCTWALHSWQWYWIKGSYYFYSTDVLFWFILGCFVATNAVRAMNRLNDDNAKVKPENHFFKAGKILLMFYTMSFLWSLWTSSSITEFLYCTKFAGTGTFSEYFLFVGGTILAIFIAGIIRTLYYNKNWFGFIFDEIKPLCGIGLCVLVIGTMETLKQNNHADEVESFLSMNINSRDKMLLERGYYEQILNNDDRSIELLNVRSKFKNWNLDWSAYVKTENELMKEFIPNYKTTFKGDTLGTNSFGLRDREYTIEKPKGAIRLAFIGGSYVMGSGVSNEENFAALIEEKLNDSKTKNVEVLNFGVGGYYFIQTVFVTENKIPKYKPDYLFCFIHSSYRMRSLDNFANLLKKQTPITLPYLKTIAEKAGVKKGMCHLEIYNRLKPFINDVFKWGYRSIYYDCKRLKIIPVLVYLPANASLKKDPDKEFCISEASKAGFHVIDLSDVYKGQKPSEIQLSLWDTHPNEKGHKLISDLLLENLKKDKEFFKFMQ
ncbi:MAG TPA: SGNH/GDSL hydrolase family protein [Bacteroidia bacterium]|jgi:hypothetical protein|nr:SGNH/GDSL hydrolase family protein [Bacteroidia bacterium]